MYVLTFYVFNKEGAFVGEKSLDVIKMHGTTIKIRELNPYQRN
jgi:hypothetical protein